VAWHGAAAFSLRERLKSPQLSSLRGLFSPKQSLAMSNLRKWIASPIKPARNDSLIPVFQMLSLTKKILTGKKELGFPCKRVLLLYK